MFVFTASFPSHPVRNRRGMALVLVLAALALLSFLVLLVLTLARNEDKSATASADIVDVQTLADMPAQIVISQIRRATSNLNTGFTWTSQPGLIRVFGTGGGDETAGRSALLEAFKLYSSDRMVVVGGAFDTKEEADKLENWQDSPALFTDLNSPIPLRPILKHNGSNPEKETGEERQLIYPILDPAALGLVEGFELESSPPEGVKGTFPMPVAWLYVLKDGRVVAPTGGEERRATFSSSEVTAENPIVARIAFWADDESSKINLNTASEPAPWDTPRANTQTDRAYAAWQPARNEFHRQAGHPAYTALSPVARSFGRKSSSSGSFSGTSSFNGSGKNAFTPVPDPTGPTGPDQSVSNNADADKFHDYVESNHRLLPGTADHTSSVNRDRGSGHGTRTPEETVRLKQERLFSTIDELLFTTEREAQEVTGDGLTNSLKLTEEDVRRARFFLTTHNAAPETNPFNQPKISLWPVQQDASLRTATDRRMALAARLSGQDFFWQRESVWRSEQQPGSSQSRTADAGITRNLQLIGYLQSLAKLPVPGYGGSLAAKYSNEQKDIPSNSDQIIISMFDLLRWGVNVENANRDETPVTHYLPPGRAGGNDNSIGSYSAVPIILRNHNNTQVRGFGRFPTITEAAVVFVATEGLKQDGQYVDQNGDRIADRTTKLRLFIILEPSCPVPGMPAATPAVRYRIKGLQNWKLGDANDAPFFEAEYPDTNRAVSSGSLATNAGASSSTPENLRILDGMTANSGLAAQFLNAEGAPKSLPQEGAAADETRDFPFVSLEISIPPTGLDVNGTMSFKAAPLVVEIMPGLGESNDDQVVQTLRIPFPSEAKIPVPHFTVGSEGTADQRIQSRFRLQVETTNGVPEPRQQLIQKGDVVRSVEVDPRLPWGGDLRLLALAGQGRATTTGADVAGYVGEPASMPWRWFFPAPDQLWSGLQPQHRIVHSLRSGAYTVSGQFLTDEEDHQPTPLTAGPLLPGAPLSPGFTPATVREPFLTPMPAGLTPRPPGAINFDNRWGDWDNGPGLLEDGPYVSKPDYGSTAAEIAANQAPGAAGYFKRGGEVLTDEYGVNTAPHRQIASAIAFGSLPTMAHPPGDSDGNTIRPWQTLLFSPNPLSREKEGDQQPEAKDHFGFRTPPDHMWLEFFWMPTMEPRALSPGFSTIGKVNLNHQIVPFTWLRRATALHAALRGVRITAIPSSAANGQSPESHYKFPGSVSDRELRYAVNATATLRAFDEERFKKGDVFRSPSEICEMFLVPKRFGEAEAEGETAQTTDHDYGDAKPTLGLERNKLIAWWNGNPGELDAMEATGDNTREAPYAQLYPRLCTRSNVFQVHYKVQLIRKTRSEKPEVFDLEKDRIGAEHRGAVTVERYLDPNDRDIPDMAAQSNASQSLDDFYHYRIVSRQPFTP